MLRAAIFDAVGTLIYADPPVGEVYAQAGRRFGVDLSASEIHLRFRRAFERQELLDRRDGQTTNAERERRRWREIVGDVFCDRVESAANRDAIFTELWEHFARPESWRVYRDVELCWQSLAARGLIIAVASNFDDRLEQIACRIAPLEQARLFISSQVGCRKPGKEFIRSVERSLNLDPGEILSVGDDLENDYLGPKSAGWQAILLDRDQGHESIAARDKVTTLAELTDRI